MSEIWEQYMNQSQSKDDREALTDDCIRADLLDRIKMTGLRLALYLLPVALLIYLLCIFPGLIIPYLFAYVVIIASLVYYTRRFVIAISGYLQCRKEIRVVTDNKCGEKTVYAWWADNILALLQKWCYLFFSKYGRYHLPLTSYKWSDGNRLNHYQLMEISYDKEEFYLVLDKKDRILAAYPCKYFKYCDGGDIA